MCFPSFSPADPPPRDRGQLKPTVYIGRDRLRVCPECAGPLVRASACVACSQCGWGRCE